METIFVQVTLADDELIEKAARILCDGGLVAFPTETVYGLGANGLNSIACKKIYEAKGRPSDNPLILHISEKEELYPLVSAVTEAAEKLADAFWPGPLTMILPKAAKVPSTVTGGLDTVAIRFPSHPIARKLIAATGLPIAAPSANRSGRPSPTKASHVAYDLTGSIDMILDGGSAEVGLESTIVDVTGERPMLLRPGGITKEMLEAVVGPIDIDPTVTEKPSPGLVPRAPGMKYKHYSPKAEVTLITGESAAVIRKINALAEEEKRKGKKTGVMATEETKASYEADVVLSLGSRQKPEDIGAALFDTLREFDDLNTDIVFSEVFSVEGEGLAIMNRLNKAAGYKLIKAEESNL